MEYCSLTDDTQVFSFANTAQENENLLLVHCLDFLCFAMDIIHKLHQLDELLKREKISRVCCAALSHEKSFALSRPFSQY